MTRFKGLAFGCSCMALLAACGEEKAVMQDAPLTVADAAAFMEDAETQLSEAGQHLERLSWVNANFITYDTNMLVANADEDFIKLSVSLANAAKKYQGLDMPADLARKFEKLKQTMVLPAPEDAAKTASLARIKADLTATYSTGKVAMEGEEKTLGDVSDIIASDRTPERLLAAWDGWRKVSVPMKSDYAEMVAIANEGAKELGYADVGAMWRAGYDMDPDEFAKVADKLWDQVKPLYTALHCYVRAELSDYYGDRVVADAGPIPAHLLGNMWAQAWGNIYPLVKPETSASGVDVTAALKEKGYDAIKMVKTGEGFFSSLGFEPLPDTFWERSLFTKPEDREVICHASAWDLDGKNDVRIKMCTKVNDVDFTTVHHELGHNYYQRAYQNNTYLHLTGANDGFHEAIGDMVALSITPEYLQKIGLISDVPPEEADIGLLMKRALDKVAFLPFGLMVDKWRWQVFSGELTPENYNDGWWKLREEYQGIKAPNDRPADAFDPGAKFHIPGNTPYMRYFLAHILQFQFHKAACEQAGWEGPLHRCSIYGNKEVGDRFKAMLEMGASKPWPEALEAFTGSREMDGSAVVAYFAPLKQWLDKQNEGRTCGW
ncbi:M2 family metallopeptidase [Kordiimonas pumila]|uniref:M2 family metallopeptidase n=1 Tax=Kordiimonas pumila TaxID=2161677 RepID=A0ABV7D618_9PROT|nr:M2 family metallopeptidase [Kordiimonas pumila]